MPLDLQGCGQFALFLGEVAVEDMELLDGLRVRDRAVGVVNGVLDLCPQNRVGVQLAVAHIVINPVVALPLLQSDLVERDKAPDERLAIADEHHLADQRVRAHAVFQRARRHILAARGHQQFFLSAGDLEVPGIKDFA